MLRCYVAMLLAVSFTAQAQTAGHQHATRALFTAAAAGNRSAASHYLKAGADAKAKNAEGKLPFEVAMAAEHDALTAILLKAAAGINGKDEKGWPPLNWAILSGDWLLVRQLLSDGAYIIAGRQDAYEVAALMQSEIQLVESVVAATGEKVVDRNYQIIWQRAVEQGSIEIVKKLVELGADLNTIHEYVGIALTLAVRAGQAEIVRILVESGARLNIKDNYGETALQVAARAGYTEIVRKLVARGACLGIKGCASYNALQLAARAGHTDIVSILVARGARLNTKRNHGYTALQLAAREGHAEIVSILVARGARLNIKDEYGETALTLAARAGHTKIVRKLVARGARLNIKNYEGYTALQLAARAGHTDIVRILKDAAQRNSGMLERVTTGFLWQKSR